MEGEEERKSRQKKNECKKMRTRMKEKCVIIKMNKTCEKKGEMKRVERRMIGQNR